MHVLTSPLPPPPSSRGIWAGTLPPPPPSTPSPLLPRVDEQRQIGARPGRLSAHGKGGGDVKLARTTWFMKRGGHLAVGYKAGLYSTLSSPALDAETLNAAAARDGDLRGSMGVAGF